jgi:hypothetical protein
LFGSSSLYKSKSIALSKPVMWKRTYQKKTSKTKTRGLQLSFGGPKPLSALSESVEDV